jgi:hypothetical protein
VIERIQLSEFLAGKFWCCKVFAIASALQPNFHINEFRAAQQQRSCEILKESALVKTSVWKTPGGSTKMN